MESFFKHVPVMINEAVEYLNCRAGKVYVDCTLGGAGHAEAICKKIYPTGTFIGIDKDIRAIENARNKLKECRDLLFNDNFVNIKKILSSLNIKADGILADLGISLDQLRSGAGFSFEKDEPLDMRADSSENVTAGLILNTMSQSELEHLFRDYGEERWAKRIAHKIVKHRDKEPLETTGQLVKLVLAAVPIKNSRRHPATKVFMALRLAVNKELENLAVFMKDAVDILNPGGRLCVISFHSLEDRIVKQAIKTMEKDCICPKDIPKCLCGKKKEMFFVTKKPILPSQEELNKNRMARSAKLRVAEKL